MFSLNQIKEAHAKVRSGADFPKYIHEIAQLGVLSYTTYVNDSHTVFVGSNGYTLSSEAKYAALPIAAESKPEEFQHYLKIHQGAETDYATFCRQSAETGVEKWLVDILNMTCTYFDTEGNKVLVEVIPAV